MVKDISAEPRLSTTYRGWLTRIGDLRHAKIAICLEGSLKYQPFKTGLTAVLDSRGEFLIPLEKHTLLRASIARE